MDTQEDHGVRTDHVELDNSVAACDISKDMEVTNGSCVGLSDGMRLRVNGVTKLHKSQIQADKKRDMHDGSFETRSCLHCKTDQKRVFMSEILLG